jgi:cytochrome c peroxidase
MKRIIHALYLLSYLIALEACQPSKEPKLFTSEIDLGEALFFDSILSRDSSLNCASCHKPEFAFADNTPTSKGVFGRSGTRNTPSAMNMSARNVYFWDGRAETLEEQALGSIENSLEMDLPLSIAIRRLIKNETYAKSFQSVYGKLPNVEDLAKAMAAYERTLETSDTDFDKYISGDDTTLLSASAKRGLSIFNNKGKCFDCHFGVDFTGNDRFKNIGLYNGKDLNDEGRIKISGRPEDLGAFKVPGLRNIAQTAPYMHNGMHKTLREVIDYYDEPDKFITNAINRDALLSKPLGLTETEKKDLESFLVSLSDERFKNH